MPSLVRSGKSEFLSERHPEPRADGIRHLHPRQIDAIRLPERLCQFGLKPEKRRQNL
jgi:hypothetical protein